MTVLEAAPLDERSDTVDFPKQNTETPQLAWEDNHVVESVPARASTRGATMAEYIAAGLIDRTPNRRF